MQLITKKINIKYLYYIAFIVIISLLNYNYVINNYAVHNDYLSIDTIKDLSKLNNLKDLFSHKESMHLLYIGRPVNALLFNIENLFLKQISDFKNIRILSSITLIVAYLIFLNISCSLVKKRYQWLIVCYLYIYVNPSSQLYINWAANFIPGSINILLASISSILISKESKIISIRYFISLFILFICFLNYPPTASMVILPFYVAYIFDQKDCIKNKLILSVISYLLILATYFIFHKFILFEFLNDYFGNEFNSYDPNTYNFNIKLNSNILNIFYDLLLSGLEGIFYAKHNNLGFFINFLILILGVIITKSIVAVRSKLHSIKKFNYIFIIGIFFSITLPFILSEHSFFAYRAFITQLAFFQVVIIYFLMICIFFMRINFKISKIKILYLITLIITLLSLFQNKIYISQNLLEYQFIKNKLLDIDNFNSIKIYLPNKLNKIEDSDLKYDLLFNASNYSGFMTPIIKTACDELGKNCKNIEVTIGNNNIYITRDINEIKKNFDNTLVIDFNQLNYH